MPTATRGPATSRDAVMEALRLVAPTQAEATALPVPAAAPALPSARARVALDALAGRETFTELEATRPNIKAFVADVLNWSGQPRATKTVVKAVAAAMAGTGPNGASSYPQALEMLSFLALCSSLLEPDRLARIAQLATQTPNAYRPIRYMVSASAHLHQILDRYPEARREQLLASLWTTAHDGRWWDATTGAPAARRRRTRQEVDPEHQEAINEQLRRVLVHNGTPTPYLISEAFTGRLLAFSDQAAEMMGRVVLRTQFDRKELVAHREHPDADVPVLLSYVTGLMPDERPESPIVPLIEWLAQDLGEDISDPEALPAKPDEWADLYPEASRQGFPMPNALRRLSKAAVPGLPGATVRMCLNPEMLRRNAEHMGNCTFSYLRQCETGAAFIGHLAYLDGEYNFAVNRYQRPGDYAVWRVGEVNSRFNRGMVPPEVRAGIQALIDEVNTATAA